MACLQKFGVPTFRDAKKAARGIEPESARTARGSTTVTLRQEPRGTHSVCLERPKSGSRQWLEHRREPKHERL